MKLKKCCKLLKYSELDFLMFTFLKISVVLLLVILTESGNAQSRSIKFSVKDPTPVCFPLTVDLTTGDITAGSTEGLRFNYYIDADFTIPLPNPTKATAGMYYIKGVLNINGGSSFVSGSVKITIYEKPNLIITNPLLGNSNDKVDLTLPQITEGSDEGLIFSYWYDNEAKNPLPFPKATERGTYFIKGTSANDCFDIQSITVIN